MYVNFVENYHSLTVAMPFHLLLFHILIQQWIHFDGNVVENYREWTEIGWEKMLLKSPSQGFHDDKMNGNERKRKKVKD